ncbi:MAG: ABC transporter permease [Longimicrobiales bacterium]
MGKSPAWFRKLYRLLLRLHPREFRERHGDEMLGFADDAWSDRAANRGPLIRLGVMLRLLFDALRSARSRRTDFQLSTFDFRPVGWGGWAQDLAWAWRAVRRRPGFAAVVIATLALGVGANTAVFGVLDAVLLTPLPYEEPERLVRLYHVEEGEPDNEGFLSLPALMGFRESSRTLEIGALYNYRSESADLTDGDRPERVRKLQVGADYFRVLLAAPAWGRAFEREEEVADAGVVIVSERIYRDYFGRDPAALGGTLSVDGVGRTVIGVMRRGFEDPIEGPIDVWLPLALRTTGYQEWEWDNSYLTAVGRLRPGATLASARDEIRELARRQGELHEDMSTTSAVVVPLHGDVIGRADMMLVVLMAAVGLLLLIACVNVASLFLARGAARGPELAVRTALGSPRRRLVRQLLLESLMLALAGGGVGLLLALVVSDTLVALAPAGLLRADFSLLDARVFTFALVVTLIAGMSFSVVPAFRFARASLEVIVRGSGRGRIASRAEGRARNVLVVAEISLALVLLIGAGVVVKSFDRLRRVEMNMRAENVVTFEVNLPSARYSEPERRAQFHRELQRRLSGLPGVSAAGAVSRLPVTGQYNSWGTRRALSDSVVDVESRMADANQRVVEGDYFKALAIPLLRGRVFGPQDHVDAPRVAVVGQALAHELFPGQDPIGRWIRMSNQFRQIIGVVADVPLTARGEVVGIVYHSHTQYADDRNWALSYIVALDGARPRIYDAARRELAAIDPALVLYQPRPLPDVIGAGVAQERFAMLLLGSFAAIAVLLAAVGIYGVLAYSVSRRRPEIGVRMALGASTANIERMVVGQGARLAALGIAIGIAGALALTRALRALVFEVSVNDPWIFGACAAALATIALAASAIPAFAATRVSPTEIIRQE